MYFGKNNIYLCIVLKPETLVWVKSIEEDEKFGLKPNFYFAKFIMSFNYLFYIQYSAFGKVIGPPFRNKKRVLFNSARTSVVISSYNITIN